MKSPLALLAVLAAASGLLVALAVLGGDGDAPDLAPPPPRRGDEAGPSGDPTAARPPPAPPVAADDLPADVPRVLPPDAAIEDVRDALAEGDGEVLEAASRRIGRLASGGARMQSALIRLVAAEADPVVRGIATAALGHAGSEMGDALCARLAGASDPADVVGALLGLAHTRDADGTSERIAFATLGGLHTTVAPLPEDERTRACVARWLDAEPMPESQEDALAILVVAARGSPTWRRMLAGEARHRWIEALPADLRARLDAASR